MAYETVVPFFPCTLSLLLSAPLAHAPIRIIHLEVLLCQKIMITRPLRWNFKCKKFEPFEICLETDCSCNRRHTTCYCHALRWKNIISFLLLMILESIELLNIVTTQRIIQETNYNYLTNNSSLPTYETRSPEIASSKQNPRIFKQLIIHRVNKPPSIIRLIEDNLCAPILTPVNCWKVISTIVITRV